LHFLIKFFYILVAYPFLFIWYVFSLSFFFRDADYERLVVVNGGYPASLLCRSASVAWMISGKKTPSIMNFHSMVKKSPPYLSFFDHIIDYFVIRSCSIFSTVSIAAMKSIKVRKLFSNSNKLFYIYNGIAPFKKIIAQKNKNNYDYCLMLSTYSSYKGHLFLFKAFKKVLLEFPHLVLNIYGYGTPKEKEVIRKQLFEFGIEGNVSLNSFSDSNSRLISGATMLLVPSQSSESFGLTIVEAMALKKPVVSTDVGGIPEVVIHKKSGFISGKDDHSLFAKNMIKILKDSRMSSRMGEFGYEVFLKKFTARQMAFAYYNLIHHGKPENTKSIF
jgi:glycosyltransferase involved in cell wall biosynthesis